MKKTGLYVMAALALQLAACNNSNEKEQKGGTAQLNAKPGIGEMPFGTFDGKPVTEYTLTNASGMQVGIINYGGAISKLITPDNKGKMGDVVFGFANLEGFQQKGNPYFGGLIGRSRLMVKNIPWLPTTVSMPCMVALKGMIKYTGLSRSRPATAA